MSSLIIKNEKDLSLLQAIYNADIEGSGVNSSYLIRETGLPKKRFYKTISIYEKKELINRESCDFDSRVKKIFITDKGKSTISWWSKINNSIRSDMEKLGLIKKE